MAATPPSSPTAPSRSSSARPGRKHRPHRPRRCRRSVRGPRRAVTVENKPGANGALSPRSWPTRTPTARRWRSSTQPRLHHAARRRRGRGRQHRGLRRHHGPVPGRLRPRDQPAERLQGPSRTSSRRPPDQVRHHRRRHRQPALVGAAVRPGQHRGDLGSVLDGGSPALTAVLGGRSTSASIQLGEAIEQIEAGKLTAIVTFAEERPPTWPTPPTAVEAGYDVPVQQARAVVAPKGTPQEVLDRLNEAFPKRSNRGVQGSSTRTTSLHRGRSTATRSPRPTPTTPTSTPRHRGYGIESDRPSTVRLTPTSATVTGRARRGEHPGEPRRPHGRRGPPQGDAHRTDAAPSAEPASLHDLEEGPPGRARAEHRPPAAGPGTNVAVALVVGRSAPPPWSDRSLGAGSARQPGPGRGRCSSASP